MNGCMDTMMAVPAASVSGVGSVLFCRLVSFGAVTSIF